MRVPKKVGKRPAVTLDVRSRDGKLRDMVELEKEVLAVELVSAPGLTAQGISTSGIGKSVGYMTGAYSQMAVARKERGIVASALTYGAK